ncbi:MAG: hypothetical protein SAK29_28810 [Scytonema sp. PMC 1069.18]|nr:hypothetical protein [Scytonema sp. PMC 1069.18]MEC4881095.1 hypothetical protein [Scytonema sp. PMC 1070.18]
MTLSANYIQGDYREGKQSHFNLQGAQFGGSLVHAETVHTHHIGGNITNHNSELSQAAAQIQQLLEQLEQSYPSNTTTGKMAIATQVIEHIESDRALAQRVLSALKAGGTQNLRGVMVQMVVW